MKNFRKVSRRSLLAIFAIVLSIGSVAALVIGSQTISGGTLTSTAPVVLNGSVLTASNYFSNSTSGNTVEYVFLYDVAGGYVAFGGGSCTAGSALPIWGSGTPNCSAGTTANSIFTSVSAPAKPTFTIVNPTSTTGAVPSSIQLDLVYYSGGHPSAMLVLTS